MASLSNDPLCDVKTPIASKETFEKYPTEAKLDTLYDLMCTVITNQGLVLESMKKRRKFDTTTASVMGLIGGFAAHFLRKLTGIP